MLNFKLICAIPSEGSIEPHVKLVGKNMCNNNNNINTTTTKHKDRRRYTDGVSAGKGGTPFEQATQIRSKPRVS